MTLQLGPVLRVSTRYGQQMTIGGVLVIAGFIVACVVVPVVYLAFFRCLDRLFTRTPHYDNEPVNEWQPPEDDPEDDGAQAIRRVA